MKIPAKVREWLYVILAVVSLALAVVIVFFGWVTTDQIKEWAVVAVSLYAVFCGILAKLNVVKPDE
jgi:predicted membrane channel-forming protein YqfA (hemolysin III family)